MDQVCFIFVHCGVVFCSIFVQAAPAHLGDLVSSFLGEPVGERVAKVEASLSELSGRLKALEDAARG